MSRCPEHLNSVCISRANASPARERVSVVFTVISFSCTLVFVQLSDGKKSSSLGLFCVWTGFINKVVMWTMQTDVPPILNGNEARTSCLFSFPQVLLTLAVVVYRCFDINITIPSVLFDDVDRNTKISSWKDVSTAFLLICSISFHIKRHFLWS